MKKIRIFGKVLLSLLLCLVMLPCTAFAVGFDEVYHVGDTTTAFGGIVLDTAVDADFTRMSAVTDNATAFLNSTCYENTLNTPVPMYNLNEEIEALYYPLQPAGYLIASYKDGHVIEFSPEGQRFTDTSGKLYYNGIMEYYKAIDDEQLVQALSNDKVNKGNLQNVFNETALKQIPSYDYQPSISTYGLEPTNPTPIEANCVRTTTEYHCVITAVTNLLQYYHDFMGADVYASNVSSATSLRKFLGEGGPNNGYIYTGDVRLHLIADSHNIGGKVSSGLRFYFRRSDVDTYSVNAFGDGKISINEIKTQLNSYARPVILAMNSSAVDLTKTGRHAVLAYTYMETANTTYFITNDSWGNNHVYICAEDIIIAGLRALYIAA